MFHKQERNKKLVPRSIPKVPPSTAIELQVVPPLQADTKKKVLLNLIFFLITRCEKITINFLLDVVLGLDLWDLKLISSSI